MISIEDESDGNSDLPDSMNDSGGSDHPAVMGSSSKVLAERAGEMIAMPGGAPVVITPFSRVQVATDLHLPPSNWLYGHPSGATRLKGFSAMPHYTGFSSFRMADTFAGSLKDADVVADAESIKKLLKMPYSKASISLIVHKVGKALLIDDFDPHRFLLRASESEWHQWVKKFFDTVTESSQHKEKVLYRRSARSDAVQERNLVSKFLYRSLECSDSSLVGQVDDSAADAIDVVKGTGKAASNEEFRLVGLPLLPEPRPEDKIPDSSAHDFARTLMWNFEDIRMLIGSDMPIFGDSEHPCVSLRLHNSKKPINILTGLDYWLDNLMCQVPEVMMCYHLDGIVQKYELIKTEDLPNVKDCKFSPKAVRDVAKNILAFLKSNAAKEGHTYWLFKSKDDDIVKLYDLTTLCAQSTSENNTSEDSAQTSSPFQDENPFRTAVSMLLYKVARNILQGDERKIEERTVRQLLENCLKLLDTNKFPSIATSVHFMLSDVYIPNDVDPAAPEFPSAESVDDSDSSPSSCQASDSESEPQSPIKVVDLRALKPPNKFRLRSFEYRNKKPPEISRDVKERCRSALHHVLKGLNMIDVIVKLKDEKDEQIRKQRENIERDNLRMSMPNEPIPMPYEEKTRQTNRPRFNSEGAVQPLPSLPWHDHLKMVLLKKAFLIYVIYAEMNYAAECFGGAIRCVKRAFNCYKMVRLLNHSERPQQFDGEEHINLVLSFALGVAGDSYMCMVKHWTADLVTYQESYSTVDDDDIGIAEHVEQYVDEELRDWMIKFPKDIEEALLLSHRCLSHGLKMWESVPDAFKNTAAKKERESLLRRLGNANNEVGVLYMTQAATLAEQFEGQLPEGIKQLFEKSLSHLSEGIENFAQVGDRSNKALLNSNSGRLCRISAYCYGHANSSSEFTQVEQHYYKRALDFYTDALVALGNKRNDPKVWDAITYELSGTYFTLGTQLQDYAPLSTQPQAEVERQVIECYQKALKYSDLETGGPHQVTYQFRAATMHHRLASLYHHGLRNSSHSDSKMAHLRQLAELHYSKSIALFKLLEHLDAQLLRVQLERVGLHEFELEKTSNGVTKQKTAVHILEIMCECRAAVASLHARKKEEAELPLSTPVEKDAAEATKADENAASEEDADKLLALFVQRLQHILLVLAKMMTSKKAKKPGLTCAKELYALSLKCTQDMPTFLSDLQSLLVKVEQSLSSLK